MAETTTAIRDARDALVRRRRELNQELKQIEYALNALNGVLNLAQTPASSKSGPPSRIKPEIELVLREADGPLHANDIMHALAERGIQMSAKDPKATVVTALIRMANAGVVRSLGGNTFQWVGEAESSADAEPEKSGGGITFDDDMVGERVVDNGADALLVGSSTSH